MTAAPMPAAPAWQRWVDGCPHFQAQQPAECPFKSKEALFELTQQLPASHLPDPASLIPSNASISVEAMLLHLSRTADALASAPTDAGSASEEDSSDEATPWIQDYARRGDVVHCPLARAGALGPFMRAALGVRAAREPGATPGALAALDAELDMVSGGVLAEAAALPLSKAMKRVTEKVHAAAQNSTLVLDFQHGKLSRQSYVEMTAQLYHLYRAMERALERARRAEARVDGLFDWPSVLRAERLAADLAEILDVFPHGDEPLAAAVHRELTERFPPNAATRELCERLDKFARMQPLMLVAHAYTRYLGDMAGGQILRKKAQHFCSRGVSFYEFDDAPEALKRRFRAALDALECSAAERTALMHEACVAFIANIRIFGELDLQRGATTRQLPTLAEDMRLFAGWTSPLELQRVYAGAAKTEEERCPFLAAKNPAAAKRKGECPWPFVLAHDPKKGLVQHWGKNLGVVSAGAVAAALLLRRRP